MPATLKILPRSLQDNTSVDMTPPTQEMLLDMLHAELQDLTQWTLRCAAPEAGGVTFFEFEQSLIPKVFVLGRLLLSLFLCVYEHRQRTQLPLCLNKNEQRYQLKSRQGRNLSTFFGVVRYFRSYMGGSHGHGFYPLDIALGLTKDRLSMHLLSLASRLATQLSFAQVAATMQWFLKTAPSTEVIEQTVLGMGSRTAQWFEQAPAPQDDGQVLIIQIDSKGVPMLSEQTLERRRGERKPNPYPDSPRHRDREHRLRYPSKPRKKKGDKSKNAKMATLVTMYTLRHAPDDSGRLLGPINAWTYASFAPKRHAFEIARREAKKRGFDPDASGDIQILTDGDEDFADYVKEYFPTALHTIDIIHVIEYLWKAGECVHREGSQELTAWVDVQKQRLYEGEESLIVGELKLLLDAIPRQGPGNKTKRQRLSQVLMYLAKRLPQMNYQSLLARDLEVASGAVEGAVKYIIGARLDNGPGWIRERAEALLQLRCIERNGDWERFVKWFHDTVQDEARASGVPLRVQHKLPSSLPELAEAA